MLLPLAPSDCRGEHSRQYCHLWVTLPDQDWRLTSGTSLRRLCSVHRCSRPSSSPAAKASVVALNQTRFKCSMLTAVQVDPQFQRTMVVASKFDNRLKEFTERWEVDRCGPNPGDMCFVGDCVHASNHARFSFSSFQAAEHMLVMPLDGLDHRTLLNLDLQVSERYRVPARQHQALLRRAAKGA